MLKGMTEEQRKQALIAKKEKREKGLSLFKTNYADDLYWQELAKEAGIRLPQHHIAPSGIKIDRFAKQLGVELGESFFGVGTKTTSSAIKKENTRQPDGSKYSMRAYFGHILELWKEKK